MPNGKKPSNEYSQQHRGVQAAVVDLLLACDPQGDSILLDAKEALTDQMKAIAESLADMSDQHPADTLSYINEDMHIFADNAEEDHKKRWIDLWGDVLRCEKKHAKDEEAKGVFR